MVILTSKQFHKAYAKLPDQIKAKFKERRNIFGATHLTQYLKITP